MPAGVRLGLLLASGAAGAAVAALRAPRWAFARSAPDPPPPFTSWDEYVMSAAGPWQRGWDEDWDGRHPVRAGDTPPEYTGKVRHLLLIRHGQYQLKEKQHPLTELGREQSRITGERLAAEAAGVRSDHYGQRQIQYDRIVSSTVLRARQTADILNQALPGVPREEDDPLLAEGCPCIPLPCKREAWLEQVRPAKVLSQSARMEAAFRKYFHRDVDHKRKSSAEKDPPIAPQVEALKGGQLIPEQPMEREYTILVCHMNITRYFVCRALQLPPECWLRMRGDNCGITELAITPNGRVSLVRFGDTGHLPIDKQTFH